MNFLREFYLFLSFSFFLIIISSFLTTVRTADSVYQYADVSLDNTFETKPFLPRFKESILQTLSFDLGETQSGEKVSKHILDRFIPTLELALFAIFFGGSFSIFLSLYIVYQNSNVLEKTFLYISMGILSTPIFIVAILLFLLFFLYIPILPPGGYEWNNLSYLILPGISLGSRVFARFFIFAISEIKKEKESGFVHFLYARGLSKEKIFFKYILIKSIPLFSILLLLDLSSLLSGAMIVEEIFFFPGIGKSMYSGIKSMDDNLLRGLLLYTGFIFFLFTRVAKWIQKRISGVEM